MALNPVTFTEAVVEDFLRYQLTTYPLADVDLHAQMRALLRLEESRSTPLRHGPFVSVSRPFKDGATAASLIAEGVLHPAMAQLAWPRLRLHQELAIRAIRGGVTTLVATGTGSGKTESFLYPIISRCFGRADAKARPGIVAVLVYPMNALAEDQLERLRGLLAGRGVTFGMYVGKTPEDARGAGRFVRPNGPSNADYHARLAEVRQRGLTASVAPFEERITRQEMRAEPPQILLTNVKQLELLLTRGRDVTMFADAPLEFLVFDEAHTFRGAQGAETACLVRRLRSFCGRDVDEVTCVATSATMADPERGVASGQDFAHRFFGVSRERVTVIGEHYDELQWGAARATPTPRFTDASAMLRDVLAAVDAPEGEVARRVSDAHASLGGRALDPAAWQRDLHGALRNNELVYQIAQALRRPRALADVVRELSAAAGREVGESELLAWLALGAACARDGHDPLLRPVVHSFVRGVGGAVVTFRPGQAKAKLWLSGEDAATALGPSTPRFALLSCTTCGQHYYEGAWKDFTLRERGAPGGGDQVGPSRSWEAKSIASGGSRALLLDRMVVDDHDDASDDDADDDDPDALPQHRRLVPLWLCTGCGALQADRSIGCARCQQRGALVAISAVRFNDAHPQELNSCVVCQAPGRRVRGQYREPARPVRAMAVSDVHVLAQSMVHLSERQRLLVFADNRQDAAFQAGWMLDHARRFRLRSLVADALKGGRLTPSDVAGALDDAMAADADLSRSLLREVWLAEPQETSERHRNDRRTYLHIQVLRELTTSVKQRLGLEPWGRMRVDYMGVTPDDAFVRAEGARLRIDPAELAEGIAALLDQHRRSRLLFDAVTHLFDRELQDSNRLVANGYVPAFPGGPKGLKLRRRPSDDRSRCVQWVGDRPTLVSNAVRAWGIAEAEVSPFLGRLWERLVALKALVPVDLVGWSAVYPNTEGTWQIDLRCLSLSATNGRWRCQKCRRSSSRRTPGARCVGWRCQGRLTWEEGSGDDFDLRVLDQRYAMLRAVEHSAQVPQRLRGEYEILFKGDGRRVNTLVCTPTLELGVNIGGLDAVLMRNVPPTTASYWQRAGRAGRQHRMAVDLTYAQATSFDQAYFRDPLKLLGGLVEAPRFNLRNEVMVRKHVHSTVLSALHGVATGRSAGARAAAETLQALFPPVLRPYLYLQKNLRQEALDVQTPLRALIDAHRALVDGAVRRAFATAWPAADREVIDDRLLRTFVEEMPAQLQEVIGRFKRRIDWAVSELEKLRDVERRQGTLDAEDSYHRRRCERLIERFRRERPERDDRVPGSGEESDTLGALAREGFLPGYGLETGSISGFAEPPRTGDGLEDFTLTRPPALALREFVPGNAIYANGYRFVPRRYQLLAEETLRFRVQVAQQAITEAGAHDIARPLAALEIRAVPICDVSLPSQSLISDEEEFRFQMPVVVLGLERGYHRGGAAYATGGFQAQLRRAVQLRLVNVGPRTEVNQQQLGYSLCLACGQSHSPYATATSHNDFVARHQERCEHAVSPTGFYADAKVDAFGLHGVDDLRAGYSVAEALRMGAARVLDMEIEDLQLLAIGRAADARFDVLLYDPMPGGSGLLDQLITRWGEVVAAAIELVERCPGGCPTSCIDCLQTYRNRAFHGYLDRHLAARELHGMGTISQQHAIPERAPATTGITGLPQTVIESRFRRMLLEAGFPDPLCQRSIDLALGAGKTVPDFFYEVEGEPGVCVYLDGMAGHIHGNPHQKAKDAQIRDVLRNQGFEVVTVRSSELDDPKQMAETLARIARYLSAEELRRRVRTDTSWHERSMAPAARPSQAASAPPHPWMRRTPTRGRTELPVYDLRAAAGALSEGQRPEIQGYADVDEHWSKPGRFIAKVVGDSMERVSPDGSWCIWESLSEPGVAEAAPNEYVIVEVSEADPELGRFTFKRFTRTPTGTLLEPLSRNRAHQPIDLPEGTSLRTVARWVAMLTPPAAP